MAISVKSKLVPKDIGNPKAVTVLPDGQNEYVLGSIVGIATKIATRTMPTGEVYQGLGGQFEGIPADPAKDTIRSAVCYLPAGIFETVSELLEGENPAEQVQFGFEVATVKAGNAAGYSWKFTPMVQPKENDPIAMLKASLPKIERKVQPVAAITDKATGETVAAVAEKPAEQPAKANGKKK